MPRGATIWLTGLPAAGKTTLAAALRESLRAAGSMALVLDGDEMRGGLSADLDLTRAGRRENVRRAAETAALLAGQGAVAIVSLVSPYREDRDDARRLHERSALAFLEVWVATPVEECARRDVKGLYRRAAAGEITGLTGWDDPYEEPGPDALRVLPTPTDDGVGTVLAALPD